MNALLIQHHVPKTAGTSVRQVTSANFKPREVVQIDWWTEPFRSMLAAGRAARAAAGRGMPAKFTPTRRAADA